MALGGAGGGGGSAIRAGRAFVEMSMRDVNLRKSLDAVQKRLRSVGSAFASVGTGLAVSGLARMVPLVAAVGKLGELSKLKDAATALNMTAEGASGLFGVLAAMGGDFKEDLEGITQFSARVRDALKGVGGPTGEAARLFEGLSVQAKDLEGLPLDEQFLRVLGAIRELPQELQATRLGLMGGTDSMKKWLALLARSPEQIRAQAKALASTSEELDAAQKATLAYQQAATTLGQVWQKIAVAAAPIIEGMSNAFTKAATPVRDFLDANKMVVVSFFAISAATVAAGVALIGVGAALSVAATALGAVGAAVGFLASPLGFVALGIAAAALGGRFGDLGAAWEELGKTFQAVGERIQAVFAGVKDAIEAGDITLAIRILAAGVKLEFLRLTNSLEIAVDDLMARFANSFSGEAMAVQLRAMKEKFLTGFANLFDTAEMNRQIRQIDDLAAAELKAIQARRGGGKMGDMTTKEWLENIFRPEQAAAGELEGLLAQAKQSAAFARAWDFLIGGGAPGAIPPPPGIEKQMKDAVRGGFAGFGSLQSQFGGGPGGVMQKQLDQLKEANKKADKQVSALQELIGLVQDGEGGLVWGV
jgi:hypothetical protein